jgi:hypothetical protein
MNLIATSKFGDCVRCGEKDTSCKKRGKDLICTSCCKIEDTKKQVEKANLRNRVRGLRGHQVESGNEQAASRQALIQDIDWVFSRIVRLRAADEHGNCECITCGTKKHFSMIQAGHYQKRGNMALRWDFRNVYPQCNKCNEFNSGEMKAFSDKLEQLQAGLPEMLANEARIVFKHGLDELKAMLIDFRAKLRLLEAKNTKQAT